METLVEYIKVNTDNTEILFDIKSSSTYKFDNIVIEQGANLLSPVPLPSTTPFCTISNSDIIAGGSETHYVTIPGVQSYLSSIKNKIFFIFITLTEVANPTNKITELFCIYNINDYLKQVINFSKKIDYNNSVPKEIIDIMMLHNVIEYSITTGNYYKGIDYFNKMIELYE